jgi:outer membrane protein assembly factor BamD (BamD/ComL family)
MKTMIALLLGLAAATPLAAQDTIKFKDPKKNPDLEGEIATLTFDLVEIEVRAGNGTVKERVDPRLIREFIPTQKSVDFARAEEALANGDVAAAVERFNRVVGDTRARALLRQQAAIGIVRAQFTNGKYADAIASAQALRARRPDSFYVGESFQYEVKSLLATKNPARAKATIAALAAFAQGRGIQSWVKDADLLDAGLAESQNNWRGALATYRKYARDSEAVEEAALGELRCLTAISDFPALSARAEGILKEAAGKDTSPRLLIAAYTGRADVALHDGKIRAALFGYLQGGLTLARGETSPEHETSLARCALTCVRVASESDRGEKATFRSRAVEMLRELTATYPSSRYRVEIEEALRALR